MIVVKVKYYCSIVSNPGMDAALRAHSARGLCWARPSCSGAGGLIQSNTYIEVLLVDTAVFRIFFHGPSWSRWIFLKLFFVEFGGLFVGVGVVRAFVVVFVRFYSLFTGTSRIFRVFICGMVVFVFFSRSVWAVDFPPLGVVFLPLSPTIAPEQPLNPPNRSRSMCASNSLRKMRSHAHTYISQYTQLQTI